jgi:hydrogenase maturation factor HypF (carbamoyltransferase family)
MSNIQKPETMATSITSLQWYEAEGDTICYASSNISDVVALIQSGEKDGVHGMQAFHMACKE